MWELVHSAPGGTTWYVLPLAAVISLVYCASRYEEPARILRRSVRLFVQIIVFMAIVMGVLYLLSYRL
jgi:hypothetical protein